MIYQAALAKDVESAQNEESALLRRADPAAIAEVVGRYRHRLYRYLLRLVREPATADDLFQQTWLNVIREIRRYDARRSFDTWLFAIAHNTAMDLLRRKAGKSLDEESSSLPDDGPDALRQAMNAERASILAAQMDALPAAYREVLTLRFEEGMKLEEIAEVTRAPLSTVKTRVRRGLECLRERMTARWHKEDLL
ncbi:MAG TPA: sigma-70 family RNA polymerase sigma factor [Candidatus Acidoferrales bacterium]|nr:sigma-70 family RNA polymerase sigma factor [Candidatus Acidoferrales bacterium]